MTINDQDPLPNRRPIRIPWIFLGMIVVLAVAAWLRFTGLDWDEKSHLHPDERFLTMVETAIQPTFSITQYFSSYQSPLNPQNRGHEFFVYGDLPIFFVRYTAEFADVLCASVPGCTLRFTGYDDVYLVGRAISALVDLATVLVLFFIGRRLYDHRVGLVASALYAVCVLPIQNAHFFTVDTFVILMVSIAIFYAVRVSQDGGWGDWILFGIFFGASLACKISVWPLAFVLILAALIRSSRISEESWPAVYAGLAIAGVLTFTSFRVLQPYAFAGLGFDPETMGEEQFGAATLTAPSWWSSVYDILPKGLRVIFLPSPNWLANMETIKNQMSGDVDFPPNHQWTDRKPIVFPWLNMVLYGMGPFLGLAAWIGWAVALILIVSRKFEWRRHSLPVVWILIFFIYQGTQWVKSMRYLLPIYPMLALLAGWFLVEIVQKVRQTRTLAGIRSNLRLNIRRWLAIGALAAVIGGTALWAFSFVQIYRQPTTRVAATRWIYQNVPMGATLLYTVDGEGSDAVHEMQIPLGSYDYVIDGIKNVTSFVMPLDAAAVGIRFNYLSDPANDPEEEVFHAFLSADPGGSQELASVMLVEDLRAEKNVRGDPHQVSWAPVLLNAGQRYYLSTEVISGAPVQTTGAYVVNESSWDDGLPLRLDGIDGFSIYEGDPLELYWEDDESKRERMIELLDKAEYLFISSSRQLGSIPRIVPRYPLTIAYYQALFSGELGFEPVQTYLGDLEIGPLKINDVFGRLGWGKFPEVGWPPPPGVWAAEEAFSVYDHPPVWIFKKSDDYSPANTRALLESVDLSRRRVIIPYDYTQELRSSKQPDWLSKLLSSEKKQVELKDSSEMWMPAEELAVQRAGGTWSQIVNVDGILSQKPAVGAVVWWLTVLSLGWLAWPLATIVFKGLPSKGYVISKIFALLFITWVTWMATSLKLVNYDRRTIGMAVGLLAVLGLVTAYLRRSVLVQFIRDHWRLMLIVEGVGIALYVISLLIRCGNPDLWHPSFGGEKPMDFAFLNAVIKSTTFPPYDPWLSGSSINYYYFGFVMLGSLIKLLRIVPNVAYNIALPMLFSLTGLGAFSIAYDLVAGDGVKRQEQENGENPPWPAGLKGRAIKAGLAAAVVVMLLGNLGQAWTLVNGWNKLGRLNTDPGAGWLVQTGRGLIENLKGNALPIYTGSWYWDATRIIPPAEGEAGPITEFPFFTFLYADLHAHMMDMPLFLLALAWALALAQSAGSSRRWKSWPDVLKALLGLAAVWLAGGLCIGALQATNTWDWPAMLGVGGVAVVYWAWRNWKGQWVWIPAAAIGAAVLYGVNSLFFLPYTENFVPAYTQVMRWEGGITPFWAYFAVQGLFLFVLITLQCIEFRNWTRRLTDKGLALLEPYGPLIGLCVLLVLTAMIVLLHFKVPIGPPVFFVMVVAGLLALQNKLSVERRAVMMLFTLGLAMTLAVELVVLSGDISRMNTVFKFYMQVWLIFSSIGGAALVWVWESARRWHLPARKAWMALFSILVFMAVLYPPTAARAKIEDRFNPGIQSNGKPVEQYFGLDGMAYMKTAIHHDQDLAIPLIYDYDAIRWLQDNVLGSPVIMEANTYPKIYGWGNRISIYTGLPSVVGWEWHTRQHRAGFDGATEEVRQRANDVILFYNTPDEDLAVDILEQYDVEYVIVGKLEEAYYSAEGLVKFDRMAEMNLLEEVYRNTGAVIYRVVTGGSD